MFSALETKGYLCKKYIDSALENGMVSMQNLNSYWCKYCNDLPGEIALIPMEETHWLTVKNAFI